MSARRPPVPPWTVVESKYSYRDQWIGLRSDTVLLANGHVLSPYHTLEFPTWVHVIAITPAFDIVLCEEYRHAARRTVIELPSGTVNEKEDPEVAARRELLEETGYSGGQWHALGSFFANPARQSNRVHTFLAMDVQRTAEPVLDASEIIETHVFTWAEFIAGIDRVELQASHLAGLHLLQRYTMRTKDPQVQRLRL